MQNFKIVFRKIILISTLIFLLTSSMLVMATNVPAEGDEFKIMNHVPLKRAGYYNYAETNATLYSIEENYTSIAKVYNLSAMFPHPNGSKKTTWEGRDILAIKISDNPALNETDEPNVLYMATHHAREVISNEVVLYFLKSICENYSINQTITDIINTRELWIVPIVNPDGMEYFHEVELWWRKNLRDNNNNGIIDNPGDGVDLNRNYGHMWGYDDGGSDPNPGGTTYRGPAPFSEPETQIIRDFAHKYEFVTMITLHSSGDLILYPWGYDYIDSPHESLFEAIGAEMAKYNGYTVQQGVDFYPVNGECCDWFYENFTTLSFTIEIDTTQFNPNPSAIPPLVEENYEPCLVIAKIADDPWKVFNCGISGKITDKQNVPLDGAKVNTTFLGQEIFQITNSTGEYKLTLPPNQFYTIKATKAGYAPVTQSNVQVNTDQYTVRNIKLKDIVPPEISAVTSSVGMDSDNNYEVGSIVRINVSELNDESGLTGVVNITSVSNSYISGDIDLVYNSTTKSYIYLWNTSGLLPGDDYVIEANLTDFDQNYDGNGSNDTGPDLVLKFTDDTPPVISMVDSFVGTDDDEVYETNSLVRIKIVEKFGEIGLSGTLIINSTKINYTTGPQSLSYDDVNNYYYWDWDTAGIAPANDFWVETTMKDPSDNIDIDGLLQTPDLIITLQDTTAPEITNLSAFAIDPFGDKDTDGRYEIQSVVYFTVIEKYGEPWLDGTISINSLSASYSLTSQPLVYDNITNEYRFTWNTTGLSPATDYLVETSLADSSLNSDNDGFNNTGPDMIIVLQDSIPPKVLSVDSYVVKGLWGAPGNESDNNEIYELGTVIRFLVYEELNDPTLLGTVRVYSISQSFDTGYKQMTFDGVDQVYYWDWNTSGLQVADDYKVDSTLQDSWGNKDSDGAVPGGPDLIVKLQDTTPPVITSVTSIVVDTGDSDGIYEVGNVIRIIVTDRHNELGLYGTVNITLNSTGYDSGLKDMSPSSTNLTYYYDWDTSGSSIGPGIYFVETTLHDSFNNTDSDGLAISPDLAIELVDNIPPDTVKNVNVQEKPDVPGEVEITWDRAEPGATVYIYRSKTPFDEENITQIAPIYISTLDESSYIDNVPADGSTYYYAVIPEDSAGNINWGLTEDNTGSVQVGKPKSDKDSEDTSFKLGEMGWIILIIIIIVIIVILVAVFLYTRKPKRGPIDHEPEAWGDGEYEEPPPPPPKSQRKGSPRRGRKKAKTGRKEREIDWDETEEPPEMEEFELEPLEEAPLHVKPGGKAKKYEDKELDDVRAALWEDMQDEFGVTPGFAPEGAQDYDYDEAQEYTEFDDYEAKPTGKSTPTEDAAVDIFSEDEDEPEKEKDDEEDEDEEVFEVEFDDEDEEDEFAEDDDVDWE